MNRLSPVRFASCPVDKLASTMFSIITPATAALLRNRSTHPFFGYLIFGDMILDNSQSLVDYAPGLISSRRAKIFGFSENAFNGFYGPYGLLRGDCRDTLCRITST